MKIDILCDHRKSVNIPVYDFALHARADKTTSIYGANVIIFEGIYALYDKRIRDLMDLKASESHDHVLLTMSSLANMIDFC